MQGKALSLRRFASRYRDGVILSENEGWPRDPPPEVSDGRIVVECWSLFFEWAGLRLEQWVGYCCVKFVSCVLFSQIFIYSKSYTVFAP